MTHDHKPLPVLGYTSQNQRNLDQVNLNKQMEERVLRRIDACYRDQEIEAEPRDIALAKTHIQIAFMWLNRAVMKPQRIRLPEDDAPQGNDEPNDVR